MLPRPATVLALFAATLAAAADAQTARNSAALINAELDKPIAFKLDNSPLPKVLESIEDKTGVPVRIGEETYAILPYGTQTPITASVENLSLRDALTAIAAKLGMRVELREEFVELVPHPALQRLGRRVTRQELQTLDVLAGRPLEMPKADHLDALAIAKAIDDSLVAYDKQLVDSKRTPMKIVVEVRAADGVDPSKPVPVMLSRGATLLDALEAIATQTKLTWYPWGDSVVVLPKRDVIRGLLERPIMARYDGVDVAQVLIDLAKRSGIEVSVEPGAIQRVPPEFRIVKLSADASLRQVLEGLQGYTGLGYVITDEGVYLWNQNSTPSSQTRSRVVASLQLPSGLSVFVREDDLSPAAREALEAQRKEATQAFEAQLTKLQTPTTKPMDAAEPASN